MTTQETTTLFRKLLLDSDPNKMLGILAGIAEERMETEPFHTVELHVEDVERIVRASSGLERQNLEDLVNEPATEITVAVFVPGLRVEDYLPDIKSMALAALVMPLSTPDGVFEGAATIFLQVGQEDPSIILGPTLVHRRRLRTPLMRLVAAMVAEVLSKRGQGKDL